MARIKKNQVRRRAGPPRRKKPSSGTGLIVGTLLAVGLIAAAVFFLQPRDENAVYSFDLGALPVLGQATAPVTLVTVEDFKCPACRAFELSVFPRIVSRFVDSGQLKVASLNWPFLAKAHNLPLDDSLLAAQAALCVYNDLGSAGYYAFKSVLFGQQADESTVWATKDTLSGLAASLSTLDQTRFQTCLDTGATRAAVQAQQSQVTAAQVSATPSLFVNGKRIEDTSFEGLSAAIIAAGQPSP